MKLTLSKLVWKDPLGRWLHGHELGPVTQVTWIKVFTGSMLRQSVGLDLANDPKNGH